MEWWTRVSLILCFLGICCAIINQMHTLHEWKNLLRILKSQLNMRMIYFSSSTAKKLAVDAVWKIEPTTNEKCARMFRIILINVIEMQVSCHHRMNGSSYTYMHDIERLPSTLTIQNSLLWNFKPYKMLRTHLFLWRYTLLVDDGRVSHANSSDACKYMCEMSTKLATAMCLLFKCQPHIYNRAILHRIFIKNWEFIASNSLTKDVSRRPTRHNERGRTKIISS